MAMLRYLVTSLLLGQVVRTEYVRQFKVREGVGVGTRIGFIGDSSPGSSRPPSPPYLVVPVADSPIDRDLDIDQNTGEVRTKVVLDRETRDKYYLSAIPLTGAGENIKVLIEVEDVNDNAPTFPSEIIEIGLPENTPRDTKRQLPAAVDQDLGIFNTQRYNIVQGNTKNAFRLSTHRDRDGVLTLDLQVNGFLDREADDSYKLVIEAQDGGSPPLKGSITVNVSILDLNDNPPTFAQQRYYASVAENVTIGTSVLTVSATDPDSGDNGDVIYAINRRQSDTGELFAIDEYSGLLTVNKRLDFESKDSHELVIVAKDRGDVPQETTAFITVRITDVNDNQPTIDIVYKTPSGGPDVSEDTVVGSVIALVSVTDQDDQEAIPVILDSSDNSAGHEYFQLEKLTSRYQLVLVKQLDREQVDTFNLVLHTSQQSHHPVPDSGTALKAFVKIQIRVTDVNDNAPKFPKKVYEASILEALEAGSSVFQIQATDADIGDNGLISYRIENSAETHSDWFDIEPDTGLIVTRTLVDCETDPEPRLVVVASDNGRPSLSSSASVKIAIQDINDNEPIFEHTFYNASLEENQATGSCFLKLTATDPDCGFNSIVSYSIGENANVGDTFTIKSRTGELCLESELDYEKQTSYDFTVVAVDKGGLSTSAMVKIAVQDINDNVPEFRPDVYNVTLSQDHPTSSPFLIVSAEDEDSGDYGVVEYRLASGNEDGYFQMDSRTGDVSLYSGLDQFPLFFQLKVEARDRDGRRGSREAVVNIHVALETRDVPVFDKQIYTFRVSEDSSTFSKIGKISPSNQRDARLFIYPEELKKHFDLNPRTGDLSTRSTLDHETRSQYLLNIGAVSTSGHIGYCQVRILVTDVNDNAPEFQPTLGLVYIPENSPVNTIVSANTALDDDTGDNGDVRYRLVRDPANYFTIDEDTGVLRTNKVLDYETDQNYNVRIVAYDRGSPSLSSTLTLSVIVQDTNDNQPKFEKEFYEIDVNESLPKDSQILPLNARDADKGKNGRLTYSIIESDSNTDKYVGILPNSGILFLKKQLDREQIFSMTFKVQVRDQGVTQLSDITSVKLNIVDVNDNKPTFSQSSYSFHVTENVPVDSVIGKVTATDGDHGRNGEVSYNIKTVNRNFRIDAPSGEIRTVRVLDREEADFYKLEVEAVDRGVPRLTSTAMVQVTIMDQNDNAPVVVQPLQSVITVKEKQPIGTSVAQIIATDADKDENATLVYDFKKDGSSDYSLFAINQNDGIITTQTMFQYNNRENYTITVLVQDKGSPPRESSYNYVVKVLSETDISLPFSKTNLVFSVPEDVGIGGVVGSVQPDDSNYEGSQVWYSILQGNEGDLFDIENLSGNIIVTGHLDAETNTEYNLKVSLNDNIWGMSRQIIRVKILVTDVNDNPPMFSSNPLLVSASEATSLGTPVYTVTATDVDQGSNGSVRYSINSQFPDNFFRIDSLSGELFLIKHLNYETSPRVFLSVQVSDNPLSAVDRRTSDVAVIVNVEDINDHAAEFVSTNKKQIQRSIDVDVPFHRVLAVDADSGAAGEVQYTITGGDVDKTFQLDPASGLLSVTNRPRKNSYRLNIQATDNGSPAKFSSQILDISVEDVSSGPPKFSSGVYTGEVKENSGAGAVVTRVTAVKHDQTSVGDNLVYSLDQQLAFGLFNINQRSGEITTVNDLDREEKSGYILTVYVHDSATSPSFDTATVLIKVLDENDHAPIFKDSCYPLFVPENTDLASIHQFVAIDPDDKENGDITYSLVAMDAPDVKNKFSIDAHSGQLSAAPLDHEHHSSYKLTIKAEDQGSPKKQSLCNMTVRVLDRNDNDPVFSKNVYEARLSENVPEGSSVITVSATDADSGQNAKISYSIRNGTEWIFGIDKDSGLIYTTGRLDREMREEYVLEVVAVDEGIEDTRMARSEVRITVLDENDSQPEFDEYPFLAQILPQHPVGSEIVRISARDQDKGKNSDLKFSLLNSEDGAKFSIDAGTGVISSISSLELDDGEMFHLEILVTDQGDPSLSSTGLVEIRVGQQPSVQLNFQQRLYTGDVEELSGGGQDVLQVQAVRSDGRKQRVSYTFGQGNEDGTFEINSNNGLIRLAKPENIDFESKRGYNLTIIGQAAGHDNLYAYAQCIVSVRDRNDNKPRFTQKVYFARAWEGNNKGTFVTQVMAVDADSIENERLYYQIVDGNHDGAFAIDQQYSGIIKTNIVLDREIRDYYELTVTATDEGAPPLTGYTKVIIKIIDINDNQPQFPRTQPIIISEGVAPGTRIGTIQANDIDSHPHITYSFSKSGNPMNAFSIDKFSGVLSVTRQIDREQGESYNLKITASDGAHEVETEVEIFVEDINDHAPVFDKQVYIGSYFSNMTLPAPVVTVHADDEDSDKNGKVKYSLLNTDVGYVDGNGTIYLNNTQEIKKGTEIHLVVMAEDYGEPRQKSFVAVRLQNLQHSDSSPAFEQELFEVIIDSGAKIGTKLANLGVQQSAGNLFYSLDPASQNPWLEIDSSTGSLILKQRVLHDSNLPKTLGVILRKDNRLGDESQTSIRVDYKFQHDLFPIFQRKYYDVKLPENTPVGARTEIFVFNNHQIEGEERRKGKIEMSGSKYDLQIAAGNENQTFELSKSASGENTLMLQKSLDYETTNEYKLLLYASQGNMFDTMQLVVKVTDENDNSPVFPVSHQIHSVKENMSPGTPVFTAKALDLDRSDGVKYSITSEEFSIGETNGRVVTKRKFDYESEREFSFVLTGTDMAGRVASAEVIVKIESQDEYPPVFARPSYKYTIDRELPVGHILGRVQASDEDAGPDGRVLYSLVTGAADYFTVDDDTGELVLTRSLDTGVLLSLDNDKLYQEVSTTVIASTGHPDSLKSSALIIFDVKTDILPAAPLPSTQSGLAGWGTGLIVATFIILIIVGAAVFFFRKFSVNDLLIKRRINEAGERGPMTGYTNTGMNDTLESSVAMSQYPPQYSDIVSHYGSKQAGGVTRTRPELSDTGHSHRSASSGRGSAEDVEEEVDHEIQMINGANINDTLTAEDSVSDISVQNGKEYLARLGIDTGGPHGRPPHMSHGSSYQTLDNDISALYNRLAGDNVGDTAASAAAMSDRNSMVSGNNSVYAARSGHPLSVTGSLSSIVHSEEEVAGSYNWDYLLDWGPQYQPLAHVFHEISALKDESGSSDARVPPIITCRPPRHVHAPLQSHVVSQARSPLSHEMMSQSAMSPSFSPALSPLATRSPSISPLGVSGPGMGPVSSRTNVTRGITLQNHYNDYSDLANSEAELRI